MAFFLASRSSAVPEFTCDMVSLRSSCLAEFQFKFLTFQGSNSRFQDIPVSQRWNQVQVSFLIIWFSLVLVFGTTGCLGRRTEGLHLSIVLVLGTLGDKT